MKVIVKETNLNNGNLKVEIIFNNDTDMELDYRFNLGVEEYFSSDDDRNHIVRAPKAGDYGCLACYRPEKKNDSYRLKLSDSPQGIGGNMNPQIKKFHGWRGTSNGISVTAMGWRKVLSVNNRSRGYGWVIILSGDLLPDEE